MVTTNHGYTGPREPVATTQSTEGMLYQHCSESDLNVYRGTVRWYIQVGDSEPVPIHYCPMCGEKLI